MKGCCHDQGGRKKYGASNKVTWLFKVLQWMGLHLTLACRGESVDFSKEKKKKRVLVASVNILPCLGYFFKRKERSATSLWSERVLWSIDRWLIWFEQDKKTEAVSQSVAAGAGGGGVWLFWSACFLSWVWVPEDTASTHHKLLVRKTKFGRFSWLFWTLEQYYYERYDGGTEKKAARDALELLFFFFGGSHSSYSNQMGPVCVCARARAYYKSGLLLFVCTKMIEWLRVSPRLASKKWCAAAV